MLRRLWHRLIGQPRRPRVFIQGYGSVFVDDQGRYQPDQVEKLCDEFEAAGVDTILWPDGLIGLYDDGRGTVVRVGDFSSGGSSVNGGMPNAHR